MVTLIALQKQPIFLLNGEVIWRASDSPLSKELYAMTNIIEFQSVQSIE